MFCYFAITMSQRSFSRNSSLSSSAFQLYGDAKYIPPCSLLPLDQIPHPHSSFTDLQSFCHAARSECGPSDDVYSNNIHDASSTHSYHTACSEMFDEDDDDEDDDGASWFDEEFLGYSPNWKFDFPVPMEPVMLVEDLTITSIFSEGRTTHFYVNDENYVQVYAQGESMGQYSGRAAMGVWFGPNHPMNVSEKLHRGRRTREAAIFAAVIESIRVAGSNGVTRLQINTDYINVVRFMIYFILKWENNGWMTVKGTPVRNQVRIRELDYYSRLIDIKWNYVPTDEGEEVEGILEAGRLAHEALHLVYPPKETTVPAFDLPVEQRPLSPPISPTQLEVLEKRRRRFASYY